MMQEKSSNDHDENKENLMKDLDTTVEIKEKVIIFIQPGILIDFEKL